MKFSINKTGQRSQTSIIDIFLKVKIQTFQKQNLDY